MTLTMTVKRWMLPAVLTVDAVEEWLESLQPGCGRIELHVGQHGVAAQADAAAVLQGAIARLRRSGIVPELTFPSLTLSGDRAQRAFSLIPEKRLTNAEETLSETLVGLILGQLCSIDGDDDHWVGALQRQALVANHGAYGFGHERSYCALGSADHRIVFRPDVVERQRRTRSQLRALLRIQDLNPVRDQSREWFHLLSMFVSEATDNTFDHGRLDLDGSPVRAVRFLNARKVNVAGASGHAPSKVAPDPSSALARYLDTVSSRMPVDDSRPSTKTLRFISLTVGDGGVGIAARMAGSLNIYDRSIEEEYSQVRSALTRSGTSKPAGEVGRGGGLTKMLAACYRLNGLLHLRTGRLSLTRTFVEEEHADSSTPSFDDDSSTLFDFEGSSVARPLLAGTAVSLLFPVDGARLVPSRGYPLAHHRN